MTKVGETMLRFDLVYHALYFDTYSNMPQNMFVSGDLVASKQKNRRDKQEVG